jgi:hypothetical protein
MNQFPLREGKLHVASHRLGRSPAILDELERPTLLHPYNHTPEQHLRFGEDGTIAPAPTDPDQMGDFSIVTYNLKRGDLATTRKEYQEKAWGEFQKAFSNDTPFALAMEKYSNGESPYSLACLHYVRLKFQQRQKEWAEY